MVIRKGLDYVFTQKELLALDDPLPNWRQLLCPPKVPSDEKRFCFTFGGKQKRVQISLEGEEQKGSNGDANDGGNIRLLPLPLDTTNV